MSGKRNDGPADLPKRAGPPPTGRTRVTVGVRQGGGSLLAVRRDGRVAVTAAHMQGVQIHLSEDDARLFAYGLLEMLGDGRPVVDEPRG